MPGVLIFDPEDDTVGLSVGDDQAAGAYLDIENDALYLTDLNNIIQWEGDDVNNMQFTFRSSKLKFGRPVNLAAAMIDAESYNSVVFRLYAEVDGVNTLITTVGVTDDEPFRLPGGYLSNTYQVEILSTDRVTSCAVAQTIFELAPEE